MVTVQKVKILEGQLSLSVIDLSYRKTFETQLNLEAVRNSNTKIVIDYVYSVSGAILPQLLTKFGCDLDIKPATVGSAISFGFGFQGADGGIG